MKQIKNPTAFPLKHSDDKYNPGMTLRDYFAGQALAGLVTNTYLEDLGELSYKIAETLLIVRQQYESKDNG